MTRKIIKIQGRIQGFFKEGVVSRRFQGKRPGTIGVAEGNGEGEGNV